MLIIYLYDRSVGHPLIVSAKLFLLRFPQWTTFIQLDDYNSKHLFGMEIENKCILCINENVLMRYITFSGSIA